MEVEMGSFTLFVFSTFSGMGHTASVFYIRLAYLVYQKESPYGTCSDIINLAVSLRFRYKNTCMAYNSSIQASTEFAIISFYLKFGCEVSLPLDIIFDTSLFQINRQTLESCEDGTFP